MITDADIEAMPFAITGTLKNARISTGEFRGRHLHGAIHGDTRGRFQDGERIFTSTILEDLPDNVFRTRYSTYKVEFAEGKK
jgi:hypothetical protein